MTITVELPSETAASLAAQAEARGISVDAFLQAVISREAAAWEPVKSIQELPREGDVPDRAIDEVFDTVPLPPGVGQGAMRREN